jgi:para-aminobenzoate synthetase component 1
MAAKIIPIIEEMKGSLPPEGIFASLKELPYPFFLDSSMDPKKLGRYSFMGCDPFLVFKSKGERMTISSPGGDAREISGDPFVELKGLLEKYKTHPVKDIPLTSGAVGYFAYDLKRFIERLPDKAMDDIEIPDIALGFYDVVITYDNLNKRAFISGTGFPEEDSKLRPERARARVQEIKRRIAKGPERRTSGYFLEDIKLRSNFTKRSYEQAVLKAKEYIKCGDIYQVNLSQRFESEIDIEPFGLYMHLRKASPAPFSAYIDVGDAAILSSSPERFLLKQGSRIETRPIKGTRPRGSSDRKDAALGRELLASAKDRAEHIMIVDLERNDLGKVCEYGSVKPEEFVILEKYSKVFHLVSTVTGKLKDGTGPVDCLLATFPGGSITGAPKIRAMEIIDELEAVKRSVYTGAIGYIGFDGNMDTSIAIRTFVVKRNKVYFHVGGGIVDDSDPAMEYEETLHKAKGLMEALETVRQEREKVRI